MNRIFGNELISERFVRAWGVSPEWSEGDKFALKDVDGYEPTGEYVINAIKVQVVRLPASIETVTRVWFQDRESGAWTREMHCVKVPVVPEPTELETLVAMLKRLDVRVQCCATGSEHPILFSNVYAENTADEHVLIVSDSDVIIHDDDYDHDDD